MFKSHSSGATIECTDGFSGVHYEYVCTSNALKQNIEYWTGKGKTTFAENLVQFFKAMVADNGTITDGEEYSHKQFSTTFAKFNIVKEAKVNNIPVEVSIIPEENENEIVSNHSTE